MYLRCVKGYIKVVVGVCIFFFVIVCGVFGVCEWFDVCEVIFRCWVWLDDDVCGW